MVSFDLPPFLSGVRLPRLEADEQEEVQVQQEAVAAALILLWWRLESSPLPLVREQPLPQADQVAPLAEGPQDPSKAAPPGVQKQEKLPR